jgi:hypothetical protein
MCAGTTVSNRYEEDVYPTALVSSGKEESKVVSRVTG